MRNEDEECFKYFKKEKQKNENILENLEHQICTMEKEIGKKEDWIID